jgi:cobalt-zinc-cadmium efflux system membrane fusion protein
MKRFIMGAFAVLGIAAIAFAGLYVARPDLLSKLGVSMAKAEKADYGLYCKEHGVPEKFCMLCHPELKEKLLLCPEHGNIPEDICTKCHPENFKEGGSASANPNLINDGWCAEFGERGPDGKVK